MVECGRKSVGCPSWDQGDPPFSGQAAWRQGHGWLVCGLKDGDQGRRGSLTPPCSLGSGSEPKAFSQSLPQQWLVARTNCCPA